MLIEERQRYIAKYIDENRSVTIKELADTLEISHDTIRRDLFILEKQGRIIKTRGGAISTMKVGYRPEYNSVRDIGDGDYNYNEMAKEACKFIQDDTTIFLGGSSIHYLMTKYLPINNHLTIVTNSIIVADELRQYEHFNVIMVCGVLRNEGFTVDATALSFVSNLRFDLNFLSASSISDSGIYNSTLDSAVFVKAVSRNSMKTICVMPSKKIGYPSFSYFMELDEVDILVTDYKTTKVDEIQKSGIITTISCNR